MVRTRVAVAAMLAVVLATACSSTTKRTSVGAGRAAADATVAPDVSGATATPAPAGASAAGSRAQQAKARAPVKGAADKAAAPTTRPGGAVGTTMKIGFVIPSGDPGRAFGVSTSSGSHRQPIDAMVAEINEMGGLGGRRVAAAIREVDQTDQSKGTQIRLQNETCTALTEDEKVFLVVAFTFTTHYAFDCYVNHRTPVFAGAAVELDERMFRDLSPWLLPPLYMAQNRMARLMPLVFEQRGFLTKRMGLFSYDSPSLQRSAREILIPEIERRGGKVLEHVAVPPTYNDLASGVATAILRFQQQGVDRVVFWAPGGGALLIFARAAENQGYRPRYGISTYDALRNVESNGATDKNQLRGLLGVGFDVAIDISNAAQPPATAAEKGCWSIVNRRAGTNYNQRSPTSSTVDGLDVCEAFSLLRVALAPVTGEPLAQSQMAELIARVGDAYAPVQFAKLRFAPGRADGIAVYAPFAWDEGCTCARYMTGWLEIPL